jgi:hypothetical protein
MFIPCFVIDLIDKLPVTVKTQGARFSWEVDSRVKMQYACGIRKFLSLITKLEVKIIP